jgi:hypothetical protein
VQNLVFVRFGSQVRESLAEKLGDFQAVGDPSWDGVRRVSCQHRDLRDVRKRGTCKMYRRPVDSTGYKAYLTLGVDIAKEVLRKLLLVEYIDYLVVHQKIC